MAIESMSLVQCIGSMSFLDKTILTCCESGIFHPKNASTYLEFTPLRENNPYLEQLRMIQNIFKNLDLQEPQGSVQQLDMNDQQVKTYLQNVEREILDIKHHLQYLKTRLETHEMALVQVKHLQGLNLCIADVMNSSSVKARFGKLPIDNYQKLTYFKNYSFFFFDFDRDEQYYWGFYVAPNDQIQEIDPIFESLYYEPIDVSEYQHATPQEAIQALETQIQIEKKTIDQSQQELEDYRVRQQPLLQQIYLYQKFMHDIFSYRRYASASGNRFCVQGFVPTKQVKLFVQQFSQFSQVVCEYLNATPEMADETPVQLRVNSFFRPFKLFITMYGLPKYGSFDPTSFIGAIFVLLFGIMFGDVGQGGSIIIGGFLLYRLKGMLLGSILMRCGISSIFFGLLYGSFFGIEGCFKSFWHTLGLDGIFPLHILQAQTSMNILLISLAIGIGLIILSMLLNIMTAIRSKQLTTIMFSSNGMAGLLFYMLLIGIIVIFILFSPRISLKVLLLILLLIPLLLIFFQHPLQIWIQSKRLKNHDKPSYQFHVIDEIFEMVEVLLSYCTNTLSFLRIGGFVLSHAALMLVVMTFAQMAGDIGSILVIIGGNLFVMLLEGLLVSIQVLRLVYYELFSRFYQSGGLSYNPIQLHSVK